MSIGYPYARALFETIHGQDQKSQEQLVLAESQLKEIVELLKVCPDLASALASPLTSLQEKLSVVQALCEKGNFSKVIESFLVLLAKKGRLAALGEVYDCWNLVRLEAEGGAAGTLVSAHPMEDSDVETLVQAFSQKLGKRVKFRVATDPSLLAGIKVTVNGVTYDGSLRSQLQKLHDHLVAGSPRLHA